jgi:hypothetical protein
MGFRFGKDVGPPSRHCQQSEAIQRRELSLWIASSLRSSQ